MKTYDYLIIGAGIAGASVASELSSHGRTLLLEREPVPGYHTTGRSAAITSLLYVGETAYPLSRSSLDFLTTPPSNFSDVPLSSPRPFLIAASKEQKAVYESSIVEAKEFGYKMRELSPKDIVNLCPVMREELLFGGILDELGRDLDVHAIHHGFLRNFKKNDGLLTVGTEVTKLSFVNSIWNIESTQGDFEAKNVINAAGAWCDEIAKRAGRKVVGFKPLRRTAFTFDAPVGAAPNSWPLIYDIEDKYYFKLEHGSILASPADENESAPCDASPEPYDIALAIDRIQTASTLQIKHVKNRWAGLRTFSPDRQLVVGFDKQLPNFFWVAGQGGIGIMTAPAVAELARSLILENSAPPSLSKLGLNIAALSPNRFD